ncbi:hypothetical protein H0X06_03805 [Candidatus Dependentiae bacterium]|nr:hypothetical protein [Candidatus Dependentiae bacterium]
MNKIKKKRNEDQPHMKQTRNNQHKGIPMKFNTLLISAALLLVPAHSLTANDYIKKAGILAATGAGLYGGMKLYSNYSSKTPQGDSLVKGIDSIEKTDEKGAKKVATKTASLLTSQKARHLSIAAAQAAVGIVGVWQAIGGFITVKLNIQQNKAAIKNGTLSFEKWLFWSGQLIFPTAVAASCLKWAYNSANKAFETPVSEPAVTIVVEPTSK